MAGNKSLHKAKDAKLDEFYTQRSDIEKELSHYSQHFKDKVVYCNCDDPEESNFWKYFNLNFDKLKLKKLITTHYEKDKSSYKLEMYRDENGVHTDIKTLEQNGDFRSPECIELLKEADIIVTNPPFSLFREYIAILMEHKKQFIVVGNKNAVTYKEFFPLLMQNEVWVGARSMNQDFWLYVPEGEPYEKLDEEGRPIKHIMACWFTNLDIKKRHEELILVKRYDEELYPTYDNYPAINVDSIQDIPCDYAGIMGVPVTFMDKYNPDQFEILGLVNGKDYLAGVRTTKDYRDYAETRQDGSRTGSSGRKINGNPVLKGKPDSGNYFVLGDDVVYSKYARIFIRNKNPEPQKEIL